MRLRGGHETTDPRLDRVQQFDPRSRNFPIRALVGDKPLRSRGWYLPTILDQGREGACVGFAHSHELAAIPRKVAGISNETARTIYREAQKIDEWAGESYEGTSVLAGAKVVHGQGHWESYRWGFSLEDALLAIAYEGPVVFGLNWYEGMFRPDAKGYLHVSGDLAGGHAICAIGVHLSHNRVVLANSWGASWGLKGRAFLSFDDLGRLLQEGGDCCVPVNRK